MLLTNALSFYAVTCEPSAWPDLIEAELALRRQSRGSGALNVQLSVGQPLKLERDNTTVELTQALRYVAVQGVVKVRWGTQALLKLFFEGSFRASFKALLRPF
jgi:hypothetical protein